MKNVRLNRRLILEAPQSQPDGAGGYSETWVALGEHWAEVQAGMGREKSQDFAVVSAVHYRVIVRAAAHGAPSRPTPDQRFREGNRVFRILAVADHDPSGRFLTCYTYEEVAA